jgi:transcription termination factor Rho
LLEPEVLARVWTLRRMIDRIGSLESAELIIERLSKMRTNAQFLAALNKDI